MIEYRRATAQDTAQLAQMKVEMIGGITVCSEQFKKNLRESTAAYITQGLQDGSFAAFVGCDRKQIIAMGSVTFYRLPPTDWCVSGKTAYIGNMYTSPDYRRGGIAAKLLSLAVQLAEQNGCGRVLLDATEMGRGLYEKYGFKASETAMEYYPRGNAIPPEI